MNVVVLPQVSDLKCETQARVSGIMMRGARCPSKDTIYQAMFTVIRETYRSPSQETESVDSPSTVGMQAYGPS